VTVRTYGRVIADLADEDPDRPALTVDDATWSRRELDDGAVRTAHSFAAMGVTQGSLVSLALANSRELFESFIACWKLGAVPQPLSHRLPAAERRAIVSVADPALVVGADPADHPGRRCLPPGWRPSTEVPTTPLPDAVSPSWKAPTSGGSTGTPKVILAGATAEMDPAAPPPVAGMRKGGVTAVPGPMHHNGPLVFAMNGLLHGNHVGVLSRFDPEATLRLFERTRADLTILVPTMMHRIWRLPAEVRASRDLSALRFVWHTAAPCPAWLKRAWIGWLGGERIWEMYAGTESMAATTIRGDQWLEHPGSVGRLVTGEMVVLGPDGERLPPGQVGEIFMRVTPGAAPTYRYLGAEPRTAGDGWSSLGDLGWFDDEGWLFLADRRTDLIITGGANVYPAEVEAALESHPLVVSAAVVGLPDEDLGQRVHALVQTSGGVGTDELIAHVRGLVASSKVPRSVELVEESLRDDSGKVRRFRHRDERS
jgi:bile acid-coenzyme A ligase